MQSLIQTSRVLRHTLWRRNFASSTLARSSWATGPAPPRLSKEEQEIFEQLQRQSTGAFSTPRQVEPLAKDSAGTDDAIKESVKQSLSTADMLEQLREKARVAANGDGEELHPNIRRGAKPEFEGDTNPKTGEVGGPKNEPQRWGTGSDWSYNGRVTDF